MLLFVLRAPVPAGPTLQFIARAAWLGAAAVAVVFFLLVSAGCGRRLPRPAPFVDSEIVRGPMLGRLGGESVSVTFVLRSQKRAAVRVRQVGGSWLEAQPPVRVGTADRLGRARFEWQLTGLIPGTGYEYQVLSSSGELTDPIAFRTPLPAPAGLRFVFFGDSGSGLPVQRFVSRAMFEVRPELLIHGGDLVYELGEDHQYDAKFFVPYRELLAQTPFYGSLGNHDYGTRGGADYLDNLTLPTSGPGGERYYTFTHGVARFICLDSNLFGDHFEQSAQGRWFDAVVSQPWEGWTFVFFHHPLYSGVRHPRFRRAELRLRRQMAQHLERTGIDLILAGHYHSYQRTHPLGSQGKRRIIHIISGGGGAKLYPVQREAFLTRALARFHFVVFEVLDARRLELEVIEVSPTDGKTSSFETVLLERAQAGVRVLRESSPY